MVRIWAPATDEAARTHLAIPMSPVLDRPAADEVVGVPHAVAMGLGAFGLIILPPDTPAAALAMVGVDFIGMLQHSAPWRRTRNVRVTWPSAEP
mgnify:CR=1 FL=1